MCYTSTLVKFKPTYYCSVHNNKKKRYKYIVINNIILIYKYTYNNKT